MFRPKETDSQQALPSWTRRPSQAITYPLQFVEMAEEQGVSREHILLHAGLAPDTLDEPAGRISFLEILRLYEAVLSLTADPAIGFDAGRNLPLTAHGSLGYALMCASTPRHALEILKRYWHLRGRGVLMSLSESEDSLFLEISPEVPLEAGLRELMFSSILASICRGVEFVLPRLAGRGQIRLQGARPEGFERHSACLPEVRFNQPRAGILLHGSLAWLDEPLPTANPEGLSQALAQCERESRLLDPGATVLQRAWAALRLGEDGYPSPDALARQLCLTPRTLRRRLREQGQSYQRLLEEARRRDSCQLLAETDIPVQRIGAWLGFSDPANFTRAFRGWTGMTPSQWRARAVD